MNKTQLFFQRIFGIKQPEQKRDETLPFVAFERGGIFSEPGYNKEELLKAYNGWVYAAATKRAETLSSIELTLKKQVGNDIQPIESHPVLDLLYKVNPYMTYEELVKLTQIYQDLIGECFWWIVYGNNGQPIEIWPWLSPTNMTIYPDSKEFIKYYSYRSPYSGSETRFETNQIIWHHNLNPQDPYGAMSPLQAAVWAVATDERVRNWNYKFFKNSAIPMGILEFEKGLTENQVKQIRAQWENTHGLGHEHRIGILGGGKFNQTERAQKDMEFIEQRRFSRDEILAIYKVPKALLDPQEINYASALTAKQVFMEEVIIPLMKTFVGALNEFLLPKFKNTDNMFFDFVKPSFETHEAKMNYYRTLSGVGAISPNEIRAENNLPPFEGGDDIYIPFNMIPIGSEQPQSQGAIKIGHTKGLKKVMTKNIWKPKNYIGEKIKEIVTEETKKMITDQEQKKKLIVEQPKEKLDPVYHAKLKKWQRRIYRLNGTERDYRKLLNKEFIRQEKQVQESLYEKSFGFDFDFDDEEDAFIKVFEPAVRFIIEDYGEDALRELGMSNFKMNDRVRQFIKTDGLKHIAIDVNETTKQALKDAINDGIKLGEGIDKIRKRVSGVFADATKARSIAIARTEVARASNFGLIEAWKQSGVVKAKEWFANPDACEICAPMMGKTTDLDEKFAINNPGAFGDVVEPPAHVNCRCLMLEVLKTKVDILIEAKNEAKQEIKQETDKIVATAHDEIKKVKDIHDKLSKAFEDEYENEYEDE